MKNELKKQFGLALFKDQILITVESNNTEAFVGDINTKYPIKIGDHDWIETKQNTLNYYECCGILLLFGITPPQYIELCELLQIPANI